MATYGYAGDFSSDDDEKVEQIQVPTRYEDTSKPSRSQIDEAIERIRRLPFTEEIDLPNDILVGILDLYGTKHGPVVPSTKKLYNKICFRLVKDAMSKGPTVGLVTDEARELNGNNNNNNLANSASQQSAADTFSDDDDVEIMASSIKNDAKKFDSRVVYNNNNNAVEEDDQMEIDSEFHAPSSLQARQMPVLETDDDDQDDDSSTTSDDDLSETGEDVSNESDALEVTPIKPPSSASREKEAIEVLMAMPLPSTPKHTESANPRRQPLAHSTPKDATTDTVKKPYTRSQRVTRSTTKGGRDMLKVDSKDKSSTSAANVFVERKQASRGKYTLVVVSLLVIVLGFLAYQFRSNILNTAEPLLRRKSENTTKLGLIRIKT